MKLAYPKSSSQYTKEPATMEEDCSCYHSNKLVAGWEGTTTRKCYVQWNRILKVANHDNHVSA